MMRHVLHKIRRLHWKRCSRWAISAAMEPMTNHAIFCIKLRTASDRVCCVRYWRAKICGGIRGHSMEPRRCRKSSYKSDKADRHRPSPTREGSEHNKRECDSCRDEH